MNSIGSGNSDGRPWRVVVAGTTFGQVYLKGVASTPGFELAGILGRDSDRTVRLAKRWDVPTYRTVDDLPSDVDIVAVVVRSGAIGGAGTELAKAALARGLHVIQEQPVHPDELADCLRTANAHGARYYLNSFYLHLDPVRRFVSVARDLLAKRVPLFVDAMCAIQTVYPLMDILGAALGGVRPWRFDPPAPKPPRAPYDAAHGMIAGVPLTLRVQNQLNPADPDNHAHVLFRIAIGTDAGVLTLADTHGPVLWSPRLHAPRDAAGDLVLDSSGLTPVEGFSLTGAAPIGPTEAVPFGKLMETAWPAAVGQALNQLVATTADRAKLIQGEVSVCRAVEDLVRVFGRPESINPVPARPLPVEALSSKVSKMSEVS